MKNKKYTARFFGDAFFALYLTLTIAFVCVLVVLGAEELLKYQSNQTAVLVMQKIQEQGCVASVK